MATSSDSFDALYIWLGIPPKQQPPSHYRLLGLQPGEADLGVVQNAIDRVSRHIESFAKGEQQQAAADVLHLVEAAKTCLLSPEQKHLYDQQMAGHPSSSPSAPIPPTAVPAKAASSTVAPAGAVPVARVVHGASSPDIQPAQVVRKPKNVGLEVAKVIVGGVVGIGLALVLLKFVLGVSLFESDTNVAENDPDPVPQQRVNVEPSDAGTPRPKSKESNDGKLSSAPWERTSGKSGSKSAAKKDEPPIHIVKTETSKPNVTVKNSKPKPKKKKGRRRRPPRRRRRRKPKPKPKPKATIVKAKPKRPTNPSSTIHEWVAADGSFRHQAYFQQLKNGTITLELPGGATETVPFDELRSEHQALAERLNIQKARFDFQNSLDAAFGLLAKGKVKDGAKKLKQTVAIDKTDLRANFYLALFAEVADKRHIQACTYFHKCLKVNPLHVPTLNNLAVAEIRALRFESAVKHWAQALTQQNDVAEVIHNINKMQMEVNNRRIRVSKSLTRKLASLHSQLQGRSTPKFNRRRGWKFISLPGQDLKALRVPLEDRRCLTCDGSARRDCLLRECKLGRVWVTKKKRVGRTKQGAPIYRSYRVKEKCKKCKGAGTISCPHCRLGVDKAL